MAKMSNRREHYESMAHFTGAFTEEMCNAPCAAPGTCCVATICGPCMSYHLRTRALHGDMSRYQCCGGFHPCVGRCSCGEQSCPQLCLCLETTLCFASSVMSTRFMLQQEMQIGNSRCDDNLICLVISCEWAACILSCIDEQLGAAVQVLADGIYISVCGCMQTQHSLQMDARDAGTVPTFVMTSPPQAMQMQQMQGGYPQQQAYAQPGAYPQQAYPQQAYPQQAYPQQQQQGYPPQQQYAQPAPMYYQPQAGTTGQYANPMYAPPSGHAPIMR